MIITQTPLRVSFAGGGTDFPDYYQKDFGQVLSSTIDKYIYAMVKERFDDKIVAHYIRLESVDRPEELRHDLIREALKLTKAGKGIEISTTADIPSTGSGLGSSSSVTVGVLHALRAYKNELPTKEELARQACKIEIDILKSPIGEQDQYAASYGGLNLITFKSLAGVDEITVERLNIDKTVEIKLNQNLMLFYTGIARESNKILSKQKANINNRTAVLNEMKNIVKQMKLHLDKGYIDAFGSLLDWGWRLKKQLASGITNEKIDGMYQKAIDAGALGGKITGAGGGGFLLLYCPLEKQDAVREALSELRELPFNLTKNGSKVIFNTGT